MHFSHRSLGAAVVVALGMFATVASAQPSDATVRRDLRAPGQVSVTLDGDGNRPEQVQPGQWELVRNATIVSHSEFPGIDVQIVGIARYASTNGRSWHFVDFLPSDQHYLGIPDPSAEEITTVIRAHPASMFGGTDHAVLGLPTAGPTLAPDATFDWHTPNSVSFPVTVEFDRVENETATIQVNHCRGRYDVRLYRPSPTVPWASYMASLVGQLEVLGTQQLPREVRQCATTIFDIDRGVTPVRSVADCAAEAAGLTPQYIGDPAERASFRVPASGPSAPLASLPGGRDGITAVHQALLTLGRDELESFLRGHLAPRYFASPGVLTDDGVALVSGALFAAFSAHGSYRTQFCGGLRYDMGRTSPFGLVLVGNIDATTASVVVLQVSGAWVIDTLDIRVRHDDDGVALAAQHPCPH